MPHTNIEQLISMIFATSRLIRERVKDREKINPFSFLRLETLRYVTEKDNPSMKDIADYLCVAPPSATSLINSLVEARQIERSYDKNDRRFVRLVVTPKGKTALASGFKKITTKMRRALSNLNAKERSNLFKILENISRSYQ
ncbi:winged helix-turn-helix transcriptional regulator [Candidatus Falkowbacteria bacterium]|nr:winged helix-turn-helix transcriptional regulator [Candidatus Falkowbacteria bacterium]